MFCRQHDFVLFTRSYVWLFFIPLLPIRLTIKQPCDSRATVLNLIMYGIEYVWQTNGERINELFSYLIDSKNTPTETHWNEILSNSNKVTEIRLLPLSGVISLLCFYCRLKDVVLCSWLYKLVFLDLGKNCTNGSGVIP
jgi:hypothetical protein